MIKLNKLKFRLKAQRSPDRRWEIQGPIKIHMEEVLKDYRKTFVMNFSPKTSFFSNFPLDLTYLLFKFNGKTDMNQLFFNHL